MAILLTDVAELVVFLASLSILVPMNAKRIPLSATLIHRDSQLSPFYNPNMTWQNRWIDVVKRSYNRAVCFSNSTNISPNNLPCCDICSADDNEFVMSIEIGSGRHETLVIPDTGSNFMWVQCEPCDPNACTNLRFPRFDPRDSLTYRPISTTDPICQNLPYKTEDDNNCMYEISYGDGSYSRGIVASESVFLSSIDGAMIYESENIVFGCSHANGGLFDENVAGMFGIGPGPYSFIGQQAEAFDNTFSYCLPLIDNPENGLGKIVFGIQYFDIDTTSTTRLYVENTGLEKFYINLIAISINNIRYNYPAPGYRRGNMIIDSGSSFTLLPPEYYQVIAYALNHLILSAGAELVASPEGYEWALCYESLEAINLPTVTMHFEGGSLDLQPRNLYFNPYKPPDRLDCIGFAPFLYNQMVPLYGAIAQSNFWVEYNLDDMLLSFVPADCSHAEIT